MATYTYRLPFPPSVNHYWRRNGHRYFISAAGQQFRREVVGSIGTQPGTTERLGVSLEFVMPDRRRRDIDNYPKSCLDALRHAGVFRDDCQIDELRLRRLHVEPPGCVDVTITELKDLAGTWKRHRL